MSILHGQSGVSTPKVGESPWKVNIETIKVAGYFSSQDELLLVREKEMQYDHFRLLLTDRSGNVCQWRNSAVFSDGLELFDMFAH